MFTLDQIALLEAPFAPADHDFVKGMVYLKKSAIRRRLNQVDPGWSNTEPTIISADPDLVVMRGGLTLLGVTRYAVGTGIIQRAKQDTNTGKLVEIAGYELQRNVAKAYKYAESDLLPRCALHFGIGTYLKDMPRTVKDANGLRTYLATLKPPVNSSSPLQSGEGSGGEVSQNPFRSHEGQRVR